MTPIYFGDAKRRLFGLLDPASGGAGAPRAALLCHPAGDEHIHAYRTFRQLALRLSQEGYHVLRFDYYGTGDSFGATDEGEVVGWCDDIEAAITELKDTTGAAKVSLVGLRLGANLAAQVAAKRPNEIVSLVLWEPLPVGKVVGDNHRDYGDVPLIESSLSSGAALSRTFVMLTTQNPQTCGCENLCIERLDFSEPWIEERIMTGTIPLNALRRIVNWLK